MVFELIESQINNAIPDPAVIPTKVEDVQRAQALTNYLINEMTRIKGIDINDRAERGTYMNGYHFYHIEWDSSAKNNSGYGALKLTELPAGSVKLQPGITRFEQAEYCFLETVATLQSVKRQFGKTIEPDVNGLDVATIITCYYLNEDGDLGRTIFTKASHEPLAEDNYYELRRVAVCSECATPILKLDIPCPECNNEGFHWKIIDETLAHKIFTWETFNRTLNLEHRPKCKDSKWTHTWGLLRSCLRAIPCPYITYANYLL